MPIPLGPPVLRVRDHGHRRRLLQTAVIALLALATIGAAAWWVLGSSDDEQSAAAADFVSVEQSFASAAAAIQDVPGQVRSFGDLERFNWVLDAHALVIQRSIAEFDRIARTEEGAAARIAQGAALVGQDGLRAISALRDAIVGSNDLADARTALVALDGVVDQLDSMVEQWRRL